MSKNILIVDDNFDICELITVIFGEDGFNTKSCLNVKNLYDDIENFKPDLIIMDIMLGGADGREICRELKASSNHKQIPIIMISASHHLEASLQFEGAPNEFLSKPFDIDVLLSTAKKHLS